MWKRGNGKFYISECSKHAKTEGKSRLKGMLSSGNSAKDWIRPIEWVAWISWRFWDTKWKPNSNQKKKKTKQNLMLMVETVEDDVLVLLPFQQILEWK